MWIICWADDSHELSSLIFSEKKKKMLLAAVVISTFKDLQLETESFYVIYHESIWKNKQNDKIKMDTLECPSSPWGKDCIQLVANPRGLTKILCRTDCSQLSEKKKEKIMK